MLADKAMVMLAQPSMVPALSSHNDGQNRSVMGSFIAYHKCCNRNRTRHRRVILKEWGLSLMSLLIHRVI